MTIHCPFDTFNLITDQQKRVNRNQISNFAIYYRYFLEEDDDKFGLAQTGNNVPNFADPKKVLTNPDSVLEHLRNRQIDQLQHLASSGEWLVPGHFYCATSSLDWRMVVGIGSSHVQETNMTLDHIYGIPYLPGSSLKGVVRSWVIQNDFCNDEKLATREIETEDSPALIEKKKNFFAVFGSQEAAGKVHFLDALPAGNVHFELDIMNPHFSDYYKRTTFPSDDQAPNPIRFLTLKNIQFRFLMHAEAAGPLQLAREWFTQTVEERGFGAKSAAGYGYFRKLEEKTDELKEEFAEKLSLDDAYDIYHNNPELKESIHIDIQQFTSYAPKFAIILIEEICDIAQIGEITDIFENLIIIDMKHNMVVPSEFGKWVWEKTKDELFEKCLEYPNLSYSGGFRRAFPELSVADRTLLQEQLMRISKDFRRKLNEYSPGESRFVDIAADLEADSGELFQDLPMQLRKTLSEKLFTIATELEKSLLTDPLDADCKGQISVDGGYTITCSGMNKNNSLQLRDISR